MLYLALNQGETTLPYVSPDWLRPYWGMGVEPNHRYLPWINTIRVQSFRNNGNAHSIKLVNIYCTKNLIQTSVFRITIMMMSSQLKAFLIITFCAGNPPVEFSHTWSIMRSFCTFCSYFGKLLNKQSDCRWFDTSLGSRGFTAMTTKYTIYNCGHVSVIQIAHPYFAGPIVHTWNWSTLWCNLMIQ